MVVHGEMALVEDMSAKVDQLRAEWNRDFRLARIWCRDGQLWTGRDEGAWLGWLDIPEMPGPAADRLAAFVERLVTDGITRVALLGMGGATLFPKMIRKMFRSQTGIELCVLDSTDPAEIRAFQSELDLKKTVFVVSSKSGATLETDLLGRYFMRLLEDEMGTHRAMTRFVAITDAGSQLDELALSKGYRAIFHGDAAVGGRYSALSYFGLLSCAVLGIDNERLLARARVMASLCRSTDESTGNPGVELGVVLASAVETQHNKLTIVTSEGLSGFGAWLEQLVAESVGKDGFGLIPIDGETLSPVSEYGSDRMFVSISLKGDRESFEAKSVALDELEAGGYPVIRYELDDIYDIGAECFRWEFAVAVLGADAGVNPFNQPDVEASKTATKRLTDRLTDGRPGRVRPSVGRWCYNTGEVKAYAPGAYGRWLYRHVRNSSALSGWLKTHLEQVGPGDYVAILVYLQCNDIFRTQIEDLRRRVRLMTSCATTVGFGPQYLHSTGQLHKGGPRNVLFLALTCSDSEDVAVPGEVTSFGDVRAAQAQGDEEMLIAKKHRYLRLHLEGDVLNTLGEVLSAVENKVDANGNASDVHSDS